MGVVRLLGGLAGIAALLALLAVAIVATMWVILLVVRHFSLVGRRHRHPRWLADQASGPESLSRARSRHE